MFLNMNRRTMNKFKFEEKIIFENVENSIPVARY